MKVNKIDCQERIQQNHGLVSDYNFEYGSPSSQPFVVQQQPWNMGVWVQQPTMDQGGSQFQHLGSAKSTTTSMMSRFESPASAFYATERCMGFPEYACQEGYPPLSSQITRNSTACESQFPSGQSSADHCYTDSPDQDEPNFDQFRTSLQPPIAKPRVSAFQSNRPSEKSNHIIPCSNMQGTKLFQQEQHKLIGDSTLSVRRKFPLHVMENQDHSVYSNSFNSPLAQLSFSSSHQERQSPRFSPGNGCVTTANSSSSGQVLSSKTRIRWTQDLHEKFVECVKCLGGADKATPKAILKLMDSEGLTIFHVKSHLQKYRIAKYLPDPAEAGKSEKRTSINVTPQLDVKTATTTLSQHYGVNFSGSGLQIREALQLQLDVQRRLHDQLEIQRNLQLRIEEQGKQLKMMFDLQQKTTNSLFKTETVDITSPYDSPTNSLDEVQVSIAEGSGNTQFPSKIS